MQPLENTEHKTLIRWVKQGKIFELMQWIEAKKTTLIPEESKRKDSLIYQAIQHDNHSMVVYLTEHAHLRDWEIENLINWAGCLKKDLKGEVILYFLNRKIPLGNATASAIFLSFNDEVIERSLKLGLCVRGDWGFAECLTDTNAARPLLRYFRTYRKQYPDLEIEAVIATKWFIQQKRKKACALMGWVGVDTTLAIYDQSPYENIEDDYKDSILDEILLNKDTEDLLKLLKIKITPEVWWHFFKHTMWLDPEHLTMVCSWIKHPEEVIQSNPKQAEETLEYAIRFFASKDRSIYSKKYTYELDLIKAAQHLVLLGVKCLPDDPKSYRDYRSPMYASKHEDEVAKLCWLMYECGDEAQKQRVYELVRTAQLKRIVKKHEPQLIQDLGLATKFEMKQDFKNHSAKRLSQFDKCYFSHLSQTSDIAECS